MVTVSSPWAHRELMVTTAPGHNAHCSVTARRGHSSVSARSQLSHGEVTARSQLNHGPHHGSVTTGCDHFGHRELTVSSHCGHFFFSWETILVKGSPGNMVGVWIFCHISILKRCRLLKSLLIIIVEWWWGWGSLLLMTWWHKEPGHQQPRNWLAGLMGPSLLQESCQCHDSIDKWWKMQIYIHVP